MTTEADRRLIEEVNGRVVNALFYGGLSPAGLQAVREIKDALNRLKGAEK